MINIFELARKIRRELTPSAYMELVGRLLGPETEPDRTWCEVGLHFHEGCTCGRVGPLTNIRTKHRFVLGPPYSKTTRSDGSWYVTGRCRTCGQGEDGLCCAQCDPHDHGAKEAEENDAMERKHLAEHGCEGCGSREYEMDCPVCNDPSKSIEEYSSFPDGAKKVPGSKAIYDCGSEGHICSSCGFYDGYK